MDKFGENVVFLTVLEQIPHYKNRPRIFVGCQMFIKFQICSIEVYMQHLKSLLGQSQKKVSLIGHTQPISQSASGRPQFCLQTHVDGAHSIHRKYVPECAKLIILDGI